MKKPSLVVLFLTVFIDLLCFGLVVPFLPSLARAYGASDSVATLVGTSFSLAQLVCIPLWGILSDRVGRRPVLLWSTAASAISMIELGCASTLTALFIARIVSGAATANIAVAQAYIADVTEPHERAKTMGLIGVAFGVGFVLGPFLGGELASYPIAGNPGALPAFVAAALSILSLLIALRGLPESLSPALRERNRAHRAAAPAGSWLRVMKQEGAYLVYFVLMFAFTGMEMTFPLFTADAFGLSLAQTGRVFGFIGIIAAIVQGGLIHPLTKKFGEANLVRAGVAMQGLSLLALGLSPLLDRPMLWLLASVAMMSAGFGICNPSISSYVSRGAALEHQGERLSLLNALGCLARVLGPALAGVLYQHAGGSRAYYVAAAETFVALGVAFTLGIVAFRDQRAPAVRAES